MIRAILRAYGAYAAVRYPVSMLVAVISLLYGGLTQMGWLPRYDQLWWIGPVDFFLGVYLGVALPSVLLWMHFVGGPRSRMRAQYLLRPLFRATDVSGAHLFSALALIGIAVATVLSVAIRYVSPRYFDLFRTAGRRAVAAGFSAAAASAHGADARCRDAG
ncbi:MAG: hypothetical protein NTZ50_16025 [Chloroflexi bacterium]|nr:hypothetical protein [Chloroflexota bacterium]